MITTFKHYYHSETDLLAEGKYLDVLKHFSKVAWEMRKAHKQDMSSMATLKKYDVYHKHDFISKANITDLTGETRSLISNFPKQHQQALTVMVEKLSGECLEAFGEHIVDRMYETSDYKSFFKLYVLNFFLETLVVHSITNETDFEKIMEGVHKVFNTIDNLNGSTIQDLTKMVLMTPTIVSTVGKLVSTLAKQM